MEDLLSRPILATGMWKQDRTMARIASTTQPPQVKLVAAASPNDKESTLPFDMKLAIMT